MPALGYGTALLRGKDCSRGVSQALELGYRHIDTARVYGNEKEIGLALSQSKVEREKLYLTSKVWRDDLSYAHVISEAETSLRFLKADYLDLFLIHWPNEQFPLEKSMEALVQLQHEEKVKNIGVSNFPPSLFLRGCELAPIFCNQVEYHPFLDQGKLLTIMREKDSLLTAYGPLFKGDVFKDPFLREIGRKHGKNAGQVALRWLIQQPNVAAIPKAAKDEHIRANLNIFDFALTREDMAQIEAVPKNRRKYNPGFAPRWEN